MLLTRQQILDAGDRTFEEIEVPEWGGTVRIGTMSGAQRDRFDERFSALDSPEAPGIRAFLVACCACDEKGDPLFRVEDVEALGRKSGIALARVFTRCVELNKLGTKGAEELEGN